MSTPSLPHDQRRQDHVNEAYNQIAKLTQDSSYVQSVAKALGYSEESLKGVPPESLLGLSCGNPVDAAQIQSGESILDLGSGGGLDVFRAASLVGSSGHVVGLDTSQNMIDLSRRNARSRELRPPHIAFVLADLSNALPIESNSIDCVMSNCVVNLLPSSGKEQLFREIYRVLRPGGRLVLDDIMAEKPLPDSIRNDLAAYVGCIAGATEVKVYENFLKNAGLTDVHSSRFQRDMNMYQEANSGYSKSSCCQSSGKASKADANEWVASYQVICRKPSPEAGSESADAARPAHPLLRWWDAFPISNTTDLPGLTREDVKDHIVRGATDLAVIDVRGDDRVGGHVRGSFQRPAQTFYNELPNFFAQFKNVPKVAFYCGRSNGRGPRCAGWYREYLDTQKCTSSKAYILLGGIKGFMELYRDDLTLVEF